MCSDPSFRNRWHRLLTLLLIVAAGVAQAAGEPAWFDALEILVNAQPGPGREEVERRLQQSHDAYEQRWLRALVAQATADSDHVQALAAFDALEHEARAAADTTLLVHVVSRRSLVVDSMGESGRAGASLDALRRELNERGDQRFEARLLRSLGVLARRAGDVDVAIRHFEQALEVDVGNADRLGEAASRNLLAGLQVRRGQFFEAIQNHSRALGIYRAADRRRDAAQTLRAIAGLYLTLRDYAQADAMSVDMLATLPPEAVGGRVTGLCMRAQAVQAMGDDARAEAHARAAVALAESRGGLPSQSEALRALARVLIGRGQGPAALPVAERSLALSQQVDGSRAQLDKRLTLAAARHAAGALAEARRDAEAVLVAVRQQRDTVLERDALELLSRIQLSQGEAAAAFASRLRYEEVDAGLESALSSRRIADLITGLERDRQRAAIELLEKDNRIQALNLTRSRWTMVGLGAIAALIFIVAVVLYLRARYSARLAELTQGRQLETEAQNAALRAAQLALEQGNRELERVASEDALTGLWNRHALSRRLAEFLLPGDGSEVRALMLIDVDHFKAINDTHGHHVGDAVLRELSRRMRAALREDDLLGRWGGEEFLVACRGADAVQMRDIAERLLECVRLSPIEADGQSITATISIGVALFECDRAVDLDLALRQADAALYRAKHAGRDRWEMAAQN
jgi:diguanylate cyclase (GGDEF)-like protein